MNEHFIDKKRMAKVFSTGLSIMQMEDKSSNLLANEYEFFFLGINITLL